MYVRLLLTDLRAALHLAADEVAVVLGVALFLPYDRSESLLDGQDLFQVTDHLQLRCAPVEEPRGLRCDGGRCDLVSLESEVAEFLPLGWKKHTLPSQTFAREDGAVQC